ncbi:DUF2384 domain-containing protein [Grimontia sp. S25]|uniref:DUF2384 domain-containing protein n=1 Tax=Grimontia sedimenti TaxID=2711294 RepID=A0A6M1RG63_9GAMM|nr:antitoxin Xre/MbcA/ParS toxin-binding domain-containing protein [Grimontia sedimenti]NGN99330.1 DUF2384 domain-containing protein [Grimontia sedimenti]
MYHSALHKLGFEESLSVVQELTVIRDGIERAYLYKSSDITGIAFEELATLLDLQYGEFKAIVTPVKLTPRETEHLLAIVDLYAYCQEVFGNDQLARYWLKEVIPALDNTQPITWLDTFVGIEMIRELLKKVEHGEFC